MFQKQHHQNKILLSYLLSYAHQTHDKCLSLAKFILLYNILSDSYQAYEFKC